MENIFTFFNSNIGVAITHFVMAILLFYIINKIGEHLILVGLPYDTITLFQSKIEKATAFNYILRVLTPIVFITIFSAVFYYMGLDVLVKNIYMVCVYYTIWRIIIIFIIGRATLQNWTKHLIYVLSINIFAFYFYKNVISVKKNLLPDFDTLSNELWIIILVFLYTLINKIDFSNKGSIKRRSRYIKNQYWKFKTQYEEIIARYTNNDKIKAIIYSIMILENFNRYYLARKYENILIKINKKKEFRTLGIMQVLTDKYITDEQSVILGTKKIMSNYEYLKVHKQYYYDDSIKEDIVKRYNNNDKYIKEIVLLSNELEQRYYPNTKDVLIDENDTVKNSKKDTKKDIKKD